MRIERGVVGFGLVVGSLALFAACSDTPGVTVDDADATPEVDSAVPPKDAAKPPVDAKVPDTSTPPKDSSVPDTAVPDTSTPDTSTPDASTPDAADGGVAGEPFDPTKPKPGDPCPAGVNVNDTIDRRCGLCGNQRALCEAGRIVGAYGACTGEKTTAGACLPGARNTQSCGLCGTQTRVCDASCTYVENACMGEVAGGCVAGTVKYLATCANPNEFRKTTCSATCMPGAPEPCAPRGADATLVVSQTTGGVVSQTLTVDTAAKLPALTTNYCPTKLSTTAQTVYNYVLVRNTGAMPVNVTLFNKSAAQAAAFAAYPGATLPDAAGRLACQDHVSVDRFTFTIPANGSQLVYVGALSTSATGNFPVEAKTNFIGAEPATAVDHTRAISTAAGCAAAVPPAGCIVNQALSFSEDKFLPVSGAPGAFDSPAVYTGANACPVTKFGDEYGARYVRLTNASTRARTVNLITTGAGDDSYVAVYANVPLSTARAACVGSYNDDCSDTDYNGCLNGVTVPASGSVVVYVGHNTEGGLYTTNNLRVTTTN